MEIKKEIKNKPYAIRFSAQDDGKEIGRAYLYLIYNDLHEEPYGFVEDVFVSEDERGKGAGKLLLKTLIDEAKKLGCYKLLGTSRYGRENVHNWYKRAGFNDYGIEFRMDFEKS